MKELRRLDTECQEKQSYVSDLNKESHMVKKKIIANNRQSRKLLDQIQKVNTTVQKTTVLNRKQKVKIIKLQLKQVTQICWESIDEPNIKF